MQIENKVAVITGGASGIGFATARQFASSGAHIVIGDIEAGPLDSAVGQLRDSGAKVLGVRCDVSKESDVFTLRDAALDEFGAVHVIFNNAGVGGGSTIGTPKAMWDWVMAVNVDGVVNGINAFLPLLLEQNEGHVISTASLAGLGGVPGMGPYCASKFAVVGISEALFHELRQRESNVGVSVLCPGFVKTRIFDALRNMPDDLKAITRTPRRDSNEEAGTNAVMMGIEPEVVGEAVENAVRINKFWILTHERSAIRTTEMRAEWMRSGEPTRVNLEKAAKG